ncbi:DUF4214 domain-containing protein, partial [Oxalobacteraceae bacterium OM1]
MATIKLGSNFNVNDPSSYNVGEVVSQTATPTGFTITDSLGNSATVVGTGMTYDADGDWISGIANSITLRMGGQLVLEATGLSVDGRSTAFDTGYGGEAPGMQAELAYWLRDSDTIIGGAGNESLKGFGGNDSIQGGAGADTIDGGAGVDTAVYAGNAASYQVTRSTTSTNSFRVTGGTDGGDTLINVERIKFADATVALDVAGTAGQAYRLYQAAFNRTPDVAGLGWQIKAMDAGTSLLQVSQNFMDSTEFKSLYGSNPSQSTLVNLLYQNVLHRTPQQFEVDFWVGILNGTNPSSHQTPAEVLMNFSESAENQA